MALCAGLSQWLAASGARAGHFREEEILTRPQFADAVVASGDAESALSRAARREGGRWLDWYVGKLANCRVSPPVTDVASAVRYLRRERAVTLDAARRTGWGLVVIERGDELSADEILRIAPRDLRPWLGSAAPHE